MQAEQLPIKFNRKLLPLLLVASMVLAACGGRVQDSRVDAPPQELVPTHRSALLQRFCGLYLNRIETTPGTGVTLESQRLSYNIGDDLSEHFAEKGDQIESPDCGTIIFVSDTTYTNNGYLTEGGAGFILSSQDVAQGEVAQD